jgi:hypothetical protein
VGAEQRQLIFGVTLFKVGNRDSHKPDALFGRKDRSHEIEARPPYGELAHLAYLAHGEKHAILRWQACTGKDAISFPSGRVKS